MTIATMTTETTNMLRCLAEMFGMHTADCARSIVGHFGGDQETAIRAAFVEQFDDVTADEALRAMGY